ncbi:MAG: response regulator [Desulfobulbaceae bacterium]|nr:response regulator [Desulfobulbaceae bacterium]
MKILIVDDMADDRLLLRYVVERYGHEVIEAGNGLEGIEMAAAHRPDLILSDALMPVMDGFRFLRMLKADDALKAIPFIFYSATYKEQKDIGLAISLGAEAHIIKPKEPEELWEEVTGILNKRPHQRESPPVLLPADEEYLSRYSEVVATKLEKKVRELQLIIEDYSKAEAFIKNVLESIDDGLAVIDPQYKIILANRAFGYQLKRSVEDLKGKFCYEVSHLLTRPCFEAGTECAVQKTFETGKPRNASHIHKDSEGRSLYVEIKSYPMKDASDKIVSVIETVRDVTEKKHLEEQLQHAQKMESIGHLASGVAHDFNNFLTAIIGCATLLDMKLAEGSPLREYTNAILSTSERAAQLTKSLLSFSRKQAINPVRVNLNELLTVIWKLLLKLAGEDIKLNLTLSEQVLTIMADSGQIIQVVMNLVTNARDAMPDMGTLTICTESAHLDEEFVQMYGYGEPGSYALLSVTDTGVGMDEKVRKRIFEPFFTTKEEGMGTGLGLSIVFGIIKQHNGYIHVYSEPGRGTTFKIYLPLLTAGAAEEKAGEVSLPKGGAETILLAEDDDPARNIVRKVLEGYGYKVIEAKNGDDAVAQFRENPDKIDLLLFDLKMPRKNGWEAYQEIMQIKPGAKILFMSGYSADFIRTKGIPHTVGNFLAKPIVPQELFRKVMEVLDKKEES